MQLQDSYTSVRFIRRGTNPPPRSLGGRSETFCLSVGQLEEQRLYNRELLEKRSHPLYVENTVLTYLSVSVSHIILNVYI